MHWFAHNEQLQSRFGKGELINGLGKKLEGMCEGGRRHVIVKSEKGFVQTKSGMKLIPAGLAMVSTV
jgi:FKBP-type peptidyl-prolyl cis-trans isomerase 2